MPWVRSDSCRSADDREDGDDPSGVGFHLCKLCDRQVTLNIKSRRPQAHKTPLGKDCPGVSYDTVHLGHDFISCAARLMFFGTNEPYTAREFWLSLLYALLGGMSDALGIEDGDINGVIRPIDLGSRVVGQEVVIFDAVPGGAGHALRLEGQKPKTSQNERPMYGYLSVVALVVFGKQLATSPNPANPAVC